MKFSLDNINSLKQLILELGTGLQRLNILDNFKSFQISVTIPAGSEISVRNQLTFIPNGYIIKKQTGNGLVTAGDTDWNINFLYMKNHGAAEAVVTIIFGDL